jgi:hypothetical protein
MQVDSSWRDADSTPGLMVARDLKLTKPGRAASMKWP